MAPPSVLGDVASLQSNADGLLTRFHHYSTLFDLETTEDDNNSQLNTVPIVYTSSFDKLRKAFCKSFPDVSLGMEKLPGYDEMIKMIAMVREQLEPLYKTMLELMELKQ